MTITFSTDNAAFDGTGADEFQRIFAVICKRLEIGDTAASIFDSNGNHIGEWSLEE